MNVNEVLDKGRDVFYGMKREWVKDCFKGVCNKDFKISNDVYCGGFGEIYSLRIEDKENMIFKKILKDYDIIKKNVERQIDSGLKLDSLVDIIGHTDKCGFGYVMPYVDGETVDVARYFNFDVNSYLRQQLEFEIKLNERGFLNLDSNFGNTIIKPDGNIEVIDRDFIVSYDKDNGRSSVGDLGFCPMNIFPTNNNFGTVDGCAESFFRGVNALNGNRFLKNDFRYGVEVLMDVVSENISDGVADLMNRTFSTNMETPGFREVLSEFEKV